MTTLEGIMAIGASFVLCVLLTAVVRALARKFGIVAKPKADRWHTRPTALLGGISIAITTVLVCLVAMPQSQKSTMVLVASGLMFLLGLVDDLVNLKPYQKVIGQLIAASIIISTGLVLPWTGYYPVNVLITLFWLVGITNAINLLDNMDGLAAGISAVAAVFLGLQFALHDPEAVTSAWMMGVFASALAGFLVFNHYPATIFMGDCGSLFIGFFLASSALLTNQAGRSRSFLPVIAVPVLVLLIPIFDTTLVFILRKMAGRSVSQGGRDHTSHRLVALGLSERKAVWMLWGFAALSGCMGLAIRELPLEISLVTVFLFSLGLIYLGIHLGKVKVYEVSHPAPVLSFLVDVSYKRRVFEVILDSSLIILSYYGSYAMVFGPLAGSADPLPFFQSLPLVVALKLTALTAAGVYRGLWRYITPDYLWVYFRGSLLGSMASVVVLTLIFRFQGFSRVMFALDGFTLFFLLVGSRYGFRLLRNLFPGASQTAQAANVLIYGAGDAGEILAKEITNNRGWNLKPVGFLDDDMGKFGRILRGLKVLGDEKYLDEVQTRYNVSKIIVSSNKFTADRLAEIRETCQNRHLELYKLSLTIEPLLSFDDSDEPIRPDLVTGSDHESESMKSSQGTTKNLAQGKPYNSKSRVNVST
jgi:UDP-GlcNAc:undecaprenyl-phosphate/decaprenyl-phosphate GlcNAc-1-phosphate transferase